MSRFEIDPNVILTDGQGRPFDRPDPLPENPTAEDRARYIRQRNEYFDQVHDCANSAFAESLSKALREG